jgi:dihydroorotate dehydrogenase electron transfer subunit
MTAAVAPLRRTPIRGEGRVVSLSDEGGVNRRLVLALPRWPGSEPGQFVMLSPGARGSAPRCDPLLPRPMAVYRTRVDGGDPRVEILFKVHGRGTALLADLEPGARVAVVGPLGAPFPDPAPGARAVIAAGGTGIASVYEFAARLHARGVGVSVLLGARSARDLMGEVDFTASGIPLAVATEDGTCGTRGLVTDLLGDALAAAGPVVVYACGPTPMMAAVVGIAASRELPCWVSLENPMACGFGVCLGCAAPLAGGGFALVCRDGPVLSADRVAWELLP